MGQDLGPNTYSYSDEELAESLDGKKLGYFMDRTGDGEGVLHYGNTTGEVWWRTIIADKYTSKMVYFKRALEWKWHGCVACVKKTLSRYPT